MNKAKGCCEDYLYKKEAKGKWILYWVVLNGRRLQFYDYKECEELAGVIEIGRRTKCVVSKRKTYSFPFLVCAAHGRYLFKSESAARRHQWMTAIKQAVEVLQSSSSVTDLPEDTQHSNCDIDNEGFQDGSTDEEIRENVLPPNVMLVASFPATCDTTSLPFRRGNEWTSSAESNKDKDSSSSSSITSSMVYPFERKAETKSLVVSSDFERPQRNSLLHFRSSNDGYDTETENYLSLQRRNFPSTPAKGVRPMNTLTLEASFCERSRSLSSISSSRTDMRFSRHLVNGCCSTDLEV